MKENPNPRRQWFRFSLRTMLVLVTLVCVYLGWALNWVIVSDPGPCERDTSHSWPAQPKPSGIQPTFCLTFLSFFR